VMASSNETPWLRIFSRAFRGSHSNFTNPFYVDMGLIGREVRDRINGARWSERFRRVATALRRRLRSSAGKAQQSFVTVLTTGGVPTQAAPQEPGRSCRRLAGNGP
jgi:hypothetical protein